jgi:hypothetical protein
MPDKNCFAEILRRTALLALIVGLLSTCARTPPEEAIRSRILAMEAAVERRDASAFVEGIAVDFSGGEGAYDRQALRGLLVAQFLGADRVSVVLGPPDITLHGDSRATVRVSAVVGGGRLLPERIETLSIESGWRLEDGEWQCYAARWTRGSERR